MSSRKHKDVKKDNDVSPLPVGFSKILAKIILILTFLAAALVYFGCEFYRTKYYPETSRGDLFPTEVLTTCVSGICFFLTASVVLIGIVRLFLVLTGKIKRMSPSDWFNLIDYLLMALFVPGVLKALDSYRFYHPGPANEIFAEKYFAVILTLCLMSFGGTVLFAYIGQRIDGSIK
jgi:hypothetical protein